MAIANLKGLHELNEFGVAENDPDPRGWDVTAPDGRPIGRVSDLIVDTQAMKARYLDVEVDRTLDASAPESHLLVPTDAVNIGEHERELKRICLSLTPEAARDLAISDRAVILADPDRYTRQWPSTAGLGCEVHVTQGGRHG